MTSKLAQVRIAVEPKNRDVAIIVNDRKIDNITHYTIDHTADESVPSVHLELLGAHGLSWVARVARVVPTTRCEACGFSHRQATLPISQTDVDNLEEVLRALQNPITGDLQKTAEYVESLLRDVRDSLDAFFPDGPQYGEPDRTQILAAAIEDEVNEGRPNANLATGVTGVDFAREALEGERSRSDEEGTPEAGGEADDSGSGSLGGSDNTGEARYTGAWDPNAGPWPAREAIEGEDPED